MLLKVATVEAIVAGEVDLVFRRWKSRNAKAGGRQRTHLGELDIVAVSVVNLSDIRADDAHRAGYRTLKELLDELRSREGDVYRIEVAFGREDPRLALRDNAELSDDDFAELRDKLARKDRNEAWTLRTLRGIADNEGLRAPDLAAELGFSDAKKFKRRVRQLKELGLTISLDTGYRISPRGEAFIARMLTRRR